MQLQLKDIPNVTKFTQDTVDRLMAIPGWVIVARTKGGNQYHMGVTENSFSMGMEPAEANFWWVGTAYSNFGTKHELSVESVEKNARAHMADYQRVYQDMEFELVDVRAEDCPIEIDWEHWLWGSQSNPEKLSGVVNKYAARNLRFWMKDEANPFKTPEGRKMLAQTKLEFANRKVALSKV